MGAAAAAIGVSAESGAEPAGGSGLGPLIDRTLFIDTHEHLLEEGRRTAWRPGPPMPCDDWAALFAHYIDDDLAAAGMAAVDLAELKSPSASTSAKWKLLSPYWSFVKTTGYGRALRIAFERLYGIRELDDRSVHRLAERYRAAVKHGMYRAILRDHCGIESCQVNSIEQPFMETGLPDLLMQDLSLFHFSAHLSAGWQALWERAGVVVRSLEDFHRTIAWWFERYAPYAVAVKTQVAYFRSLDFSPITAERAAPIFERILAGEAVDAADRKVVDDHIFWHCVGKAREHDLPVKLHTGYLAGHDGMQISRTATDPSAVCDLLRAFPDVRFVLMHIGYPFHEQMIALAKHYHNAYVDMCWAWIVNPEASVRFLRDFLVTAPANKVLTFGGDYWAVEPIVGHAAMARRGLRLALEDLVRRGWLSHREALDLVPQLMNGNARRLFRLGDKARLLSSAPWIRSEGRGAP